VATGTGTTDDPWVLETPYRDADADPPRIACQVGRATLT
jgi:hypothetical protein